MANFAFSDILSSTHLNHKVNFEELHKFSKDAGLRDYQIASKRRIYTAWQTCRGVMLQMPTGTGKTVLFTDIVKDLCLYGKRHNMVVKVLILAHKRELIAQISDTLERHHISHGIIMSQNIERKSRIVQVGSVPTLNRRLDRWEDNDFDFIIIDEAHHVKAKSYKEIIKQYPNAKILGVTATPYRLNGAGFRPEFDKLVLSWPISKFIKLGYLCDFRYHSISSGSLLQSEIDQMKIDDKGDYIDADMMSVMNRPNIRAEIVNTYLKFAKGKKGIVYTVNQDHNKCLKQQFKDAGVRVEMIDSKTPQEERDEIVEKFRRGQFDILCNVNIFSEGFDCPDVEFIQLARPTRSLAMYLQQVGRGLRPSAGKRLIILDNVGLYNRFGFPDRSINWRAYFEGCDSPEDYCVHFEPSNEDIPRNVIPIDEGHEEVFMLYETNTGNVLNNDDNRLINQLDIEDEIDTAITKAEQEYHQRQYVIDYCKEKGYPIPQEMIADAEKYKIESCPIVHIKKNIENYIQSNFDASHYVDFSFNAEDGLGQEKEDINMQIEAIEEELESIEQTIEGYTSYIKCSPPKDLVLRKENCHQVINECNNKWAFLDAMEERFCLLSKYEFTATFINGVLHIE